jgi:hypothetical protein
VVPSGQTVTFVEIIRDAPGVSGLTYRFRFLAPAIGRNSGTISSEVALEDMKALCETYALPKLANLGPQVEQIVVSLADRPVAFGDPDPEATQYFEAFHPEGGACIWDGF